MLVGCPLCPLKHLGEEAVIEEVDEAEECLREIDDNDVCRDHDAEVGICVAYQKGEGVDCFEAEVPESASEIYDCEKKSEKGEGEATEPGSEGI